MNKLISYQNSISVSYYGTSHSSVALEEQNVKSTTTNITLRFKTHQSNGMLMLAAGPIHYCLITLENGQIIVCKFLFKSILHLHFFKKKN